MDRGTGEQEAAWKSGRKFVFLGCSSEGTSVPRGLADECQQMRQASTPAIAVSGGITPGPLQSNGPHRKLECPGLCVGAARETRAEMELPSGAKVQPQERGLGGVSGPAGPQRLLGPISGDLRRTGQVLLLRLGKARITCSHRHSGHKGLCLDHSHKEPSSGGLLGRGRKI